MSASAQSNCASVAPAIASRVAAARISPSAVSAARRRSVSFSRATCLSLSALSKRSIGLSLRLLKNATAQYSQIAVIITCVGPIRPPKFQRRPQGTPRLRRHNAGRGKTRSDIAAGRSISPLPHGSGHQSSRWNVCFVPEVDIDAHGARRLAIEGAQCAEAPGTRRCAVRFRRN